MAMTPEERNKLENLERIVDSLLRVENIEFIANVKRRGTQGIKTDGTGTVSSIRKSVDEGGASSYSVCDSPDVKLKIVTTSGDVYYLPAFTS